MMVLPHSQHAHRPPARSFHSDRIEEVERHPSSHHSHHALRSPHGHIGDQVAPSTSATPVHLHPSPHGLIHNPSQHSSHHIHHHSVHHPQPHYHMPPHYHMRPPFQMRSYLPGQSSAPTLKDERLESAKISDEPNSSFKLNEEAQSADRKFQPLDGLHNPGVEPPLSRSSPYHPVRRRGEAAAMIDIGEGKSLLLMLQYFNRIVQWYLTGVKGKKSYRIL